MSLAKITLIGLENYANLQLSSSLFSDINLPQGIEKDLVINNILTDCGEFEVLYADFDFMKFQVKMFFERYYATFNKMYRAITEDYNPLHNYDRYEESTDNLTSSDININNSSSNGSSNSTTTDTGQNKNTNNVSAYDVSTYSPKEQDIFDINTSESNNSSSSAVNQSTDNRNRNDENKHKAHLYGNIGVTTSMQMLSEEVEGRKKYNIYDLISSIFLQNLCVAVYD